MIAAGLLYLGLFALAAGMPRHAHALLGRWYRPGLAERLPWLGWLLVALSLAGGLAAPDWPRALVQWFGGAPLAAGLVLLALTYAPVAARAAVPVALGAVALGWLG